MADAKHAPGWELREFAHEVAYGQARRIYRMEIVEPRFQHGNRMASRRVCQIIDFGNYTDDMEYARLIAAAPTLLSLLQEVREQQFGIGIYGIPEPLLIKIDEAVASATKDSRK